MEKECSRCHRLFNTTQEQNEICPECLKLEFRAAAPLDDAERRDLAEEFRQADKRQAQRALRMQDGYETGALFNWSGKLSFAAGCLLYVFCHLLFMATLSSDTPNIINDMAGAAQCSVALMLCLFAALLVVISTRRRPFIVYPVAALMLLSGWKMPGFWKTHVPREKTEAVAAEAEAQPETAEVAQDVPVNARVLTRSDLDVFYQQKASAPQVAHYAVYMDRQDSRTRAIIRDALTRLLGAEYTRAYTRNEGALYIVSNVPGRTKNISRILGRFGHVTFASPSEGTYELRFDPDKTNMVSRYPAEVLSSPLHSSYVAANIAEITSLDPMRVRAAARNLASSNVQVLRREIHDALVAVLHDPWSSDPDTHAALAEAMTVYAYEKDSQAIEVCREFFRAGLVMKREIPESVTRYLVREVPDEMVAPIVEFWCENPIAWGETMSQLGIRVQPTLLEKLRSTDSIRQIGTIIRYLRDYGDARAIPAVTPFLEHQDSIIRHTAQETLNALEKRK